MAMNGAPPLRIDQLSASFDGIKAVSEVSLDIHAGTVVAIIGPNGAGKTTLFNLVCGNVGCDEGHVWVKGIDVTGRRADQIAALGVGRSFQDCKVLEQMTVLENVLIGMRDRRHETIWAALAQFRSVRTSEWTRQNQALELLEDVGLTEKAASFACELSYGQRKLLELARVRASAPRVYLLDEPFAGLFPEIRRRMEAVIRQIRDCGHAVVFIEHDMEAVAGVADRAVGLHFGRVIADGTPAAVLRDAAVLDAYLGRE